MGGVGCLGWLFLVVKDGHEENQLCLWIWFFGYTENLDSPSGVSSVGLVMFRRFKL